MKLPMRIVMFIITSILLGIVPCQSHAKESVSKAIAEAMGKSFSPKDAATYGVNIVSYSMEKKDFAEATKKLMGNDVIWDLLGKNAEAFFEMDPKFIPDWKDRIFLIKDTLDKTGQALIAIESDHYDDAGIAATDVVVASVNHPLVTVVWEAGKLTYESHKAVIATGAALQVESLYSRLELDRRLVGKTVDSKPPTIPITQSNIDYFYDTYLIENRATRGQVKAYVETVLGEEFPEISWEVDRSTPEDLDDIIDGLNAQRNFMTQLFGGSDDAEVDAVEAVRPRARSWIKRLLEDINKQAELRWRKTMFRKHYEDFKRLRADATSGINDANAFLYFLSEQKPLGLSDVLLALQEKYNQAKEQENLKSSGLANANELAEEIIKEALTHAKTARLVRKTQMAAAFEALAKDASHIVEKYQAEYDDLYHKEEVASLKRSINAVSDDEDLSDQEKEEDIAKLQQKLQDEEEYNERRKTRKEKNKEVLQAVIATLKNSRMLPSERLSQAWHLENSGLSGPEENVADAYIKAFRKLLYDAETKVKDRLYQMMQISPKVRSFTFDELLNPENYTLPTQFVDNYEKYIEAHQYHDMGMLKEGDTSNILFGYIDRVGKIIYYKTNTLQRQMMPAPDGHQQLEALGILQGQKNTWQNAEELDPVLVDIYAQEHKGFSAEQFNAIANSITNNFASFNYEAERLRLEKAINTYQDYYDNWKSDIAYVRKMYDQYANWYRNKIPSPSDEYITKGQTRIYYLNDDGYVIRNTDSGSYVESLTAYREVMKQNLASLMQLPVYDFLAKRGPTFLKELQDEMLGTNYNFISEKNAFYHDSRGSKKWVVVRERDLDKAIAHVNSIDYRQKTEPYKKKVEKVLTLVPGAFWWWNNNTDSIVSTVFERKWALLQEKAQTLHDALEKLDQKRHGRYKETEEEKARRLEEEKRKREEELKRQREEEARRAEAARRAQEAANAQRQAEQQKVRDFYEKFKRSYERKDDASLLFMMDDDWQAGDGTTLYDVEDNFRRMFRIYDDLSYTITNLSVPMSNSGLYQVRYTVEIVGKNYERNITRKEKSSVVEIISVKDGKVKLFRTESGNFWFVK